MWVGLHALNSATISALLESRSTVEDDTASITTIGGGGGGGAADGGALAYGAAQRQVPTYLLPVQLILFSFLLPPRIWGWPAIHMQRIYVP